MARLHLSQPLCRRIRSSIVMVRQPQTGIAETTIMPRSSAMVPSFRADALPVARPALAGRKPVQPGPADATGGDLGLRCEADEPALNRGFPAPAPPFIVLYLWWIEGFRGIRHSYRTQSRLTGTGRQPRARRPSSRPVSVSRRDLASRLRPLQASLKRRLTRADVLADMIRAVNSSLDPEKVAEAIVARVSDWIPAPGWLVLAVDGGGRTRAMAASGLTADARVRGVRRAAAG